MKRILLIVIAIIQIAYFSYWYSCLRLADLYYFSAFNFKLRLEDTARYDSYQPYLIAKIFNNKVSGFAVEVYSILSHYLDITFLIQFFSLIGCFGIVLGLHFIWKLEKGKAMALFTVIVLLLSLSIFLPSNRFFMPFIFTFMATGLLLSLYGVKKAFDSWPRLLPVFVILILLSVWWYFVFGSNLVKFCIA